MNVKYVRWLQKGAENFLDMIMLNCRTTPGTIHRYFSSEGPEHKLGIPPVSEYVAVDCEMVGVGEKIKSALARCSVVDYYGKVLCDIYCKPDEEITDYRTSYSGITELHMKTALPLPVALEKIHNILQGKILVGHDINNDLKHLLFQASDDRLRDTKRYPFRDVNNNVHFGRNLRHLVSEFFGLSIQSGSHCSIVDACAAMSLYRLFRIEWEMTLTQKKQGQQSEIESLEEAFVKHQKLTSRRNHLMHQVTWQIETHHTDISSVYLLLHDMKSIEFELEEQQALIDKLTNEMWLQQESFKSQIEDYDHRHSFKRQEVIKNLSQHIVNSNARQQKTRRK